MKPVIFFSENNVLRRLFSLFTFLLLLSLGSTLAHAQFAGGDGTEANPYRVATAEQLNAIRDHLDAHFVQTADIDLGVAPWNEGEGWVPLRVNRSSTNPRDIDFTGSFDGAGYRISNLTINRPDVGNQGLFGRASGATLKNIHLKDVDVTGGGLRTGGLVGETVSNSSINHCSVTGRIIAGGTAGGLAGHTHNSYVHYSSVNAEVSGTNGAGGLIGSTMNTPIRHSWSVGQVTRAGEGTSGSFGGLVGSINGDNTAIADSYSRAAVSGNGGRVGGFIGYIQTGRVSRCYSTGAVTGNGDHVGGFVGEGFGRGIQFSFWDIETSGQTDSAGTNHQSNFLLGKTTAELQQQETFAGFNFFNLWTINEGEDYPVFQDLTIYRQPQPVELSDLTGSGTLEDPYQISTADELNAIRQDVSEDHHYYQLINDIDLVDTVVWNHGLGWNPITNRLWVRHPYNIARFTGNFDGGGHRIRNLTVNRPEGGYSGTASAGLFSKIESGVVHDLHLENVQILGYFQVGGLTAEAARSTIERCSVTGQVLSDGSVGGLVGSLSGSGSSLSQVSAVVEVFGFHRVGGLAGSLSLYTTTRQAWSDGSVVQLSTSSGSVGGFAGHFNGGSSTSVVGVIRDSYSHADISFRRDDAEYTGSAGGFLGSHQTGAIQHCYSTGAITVFSDSIGGFIGSGRSSLINGYWDIDRSGQASSAGGEHVLGRSTLEMTAPHALNTYAGWDFADIWTADTDYTRNEGYPYLAAFSPEDGVTMTLTANPTTGGTISGSGLYTYGERVTARARANVGYRFLGWYEQGSLVSSSWSYTFTATADRNLVAEFESDEPVIPDTYALSVSKVGNGTVISNPAGIDCGRTCTAQFNENTQVTLTATAATDSVFTGWSGTCTGTGACTVTMSQARTVTATFVANDEPPIISHTLTVTKTGTGNGTITSRPAGINCTWPWPRQGVGGAGDGYLWGFSPGDGIDSYFIAPDVYHRDWRSVEELRLMLWSQRGSYYTSGSRGWRGDIYLANGDMYAHMLLPRNAHSATWESFVVQFADSSIQWTLGGGAQTLNDVLANVTAFHVRSEYGIGDTYSGLDSVEIFGSERSHPVIASYFPRDDMEDWTIDIGDAMNPGGDQVCEAEFDTDTEVTLTATAASGSVFTGWGGACTGTGACTVTMSQARNVTATFRSDSSTCPYDDNLSLSNQTISSQQDFGACHRLSAGPDVTITASAQVGFVAGERIELQPGFRVQFGGRFTARIDSSLADSD